MAESHEHITCREVVELVTEYLDDAMSADEASLFEQHLNFCDGCVWYVDQLRTTIAAAARVREEDLPPEARERLMSAFRDWRRS
jgi:anti-sigma factor (TIGR02949 family)